MHPVNLHFEPLVRSFFEPSAETVAPLLLGHRLVRRTPVGFSGGIIVETEAYLADDPASHGYKRETPRNGSMFGPPGRAYVYFIYGTHWCFNVVCRSAGCAEAVLVRAIQPVFGLDWMQDQRSVANPRDLTNGPAKTCAALAIDRSFDGADLCAMGSPVFLAANPEWKEVRSSLGQVTTAKRIGLTQAAHLPLRFYLAESEHVSRRDRAG